MFLSFTIGHELSWMPLSPAMQRMGRIISPSYVAAACTPRGYKAAKFSNLTGDFYYEYEGDYRPRSYSLDGHLFARYPSQAFTAHGRIYAFSCCPVYFSWLDINQMIECPEHHLRSESWLEFMCRNMRKHTHVKNK